MPSVSDAAAPERARPSRGCRERVRPPATLAGRPQCLAGALVLTVWPARCRSACAQLHGHTRVCSAGRDCCTYTTRSCTERPVG